jgi:DNA (cytosine-5)-methyltransferase 1
MPKPAASLPQKYHPIHHGPEIFSRNPPVLTSAEQEWREKVIAFLREHSAILLTDSTQIIESTVLRERQTPYLTTEDNLALASLTQPEETKIRLRESLTQTVLIPLRIINEILHIQFGSPNLGNQKNLIDELVYILLTRRSKNSDAGKHLVAIKAKYITWADVVNVPPEELKAIIMGGGLEAHKVKFIQDSLQYIQKQFGRIDEADFIDMSDWQLDQFLQQLPGVGKKTAACILMNVRGTDIFVADTHSIRVVDRLGIFKEFGLTWRQEDHKKAQEELSILIPPHIRGNLHRNLVALGQEICKPIPECDHCELKKICMHYRTNAQIAHAKEKKSLVIDMFCGAGGFSLGLSRVGFKIVAAIDNNPDAIRTYRLNHPEIPDEAIIEDEIQSDARRVKLKQLRNLLKGQELDLLVGGPPCQGYSMMGNRVPHKYENGNKSFGSDYKFTEDKRNHLFKAMLRVARELKPRYVVIENVPGLGSANIKKEKSYVKYIAENLEKLGYQVEWYLLEAINFYIPQNRHRFFIFGSRQGERVPNWEKLKQEIPKEQMTSLKHALYDLPRLFISDGRWVAAHSNNIGRNNEWDQQYLGPFQIRGSTHILFNHVSRFNNEDDIKLYSELKEGETYQELVERIGMQKQFFKNYEIKNFHDKYYRLEWEGQSKTIVSHLHKDGNSFVHPDPDRQIRSLSVREAARIQSFPDDYIFCGSRGAQFIQIGNAVPPVMAQAIGQVLMEAIRAQENGIGND